MILKLTSVCLLLLFSSSLLAQKQVREIDPNRAEYYEAIEEKKRELERKQKAEADKLIQEKKDLITLEENNKKKQAEAEEKKRELERIAENNKKIEHLKELELKLKVKKETLALKQKIDQEFKQKAEQEKLKAAEDLARQAEAKKKKDADEKAEAQRKAELIERYNKAKLEHELLKQHKAAEFKNRVIEKPKTEIQTNFPVPAAVQTIQVDPNSTRTHTLISPGTSQQYLSLNGPTTVVFPTVIKFENERRIAKTQPFTTKQMSNYLGCNFDLGPSAKDFRTIIFTHEINGYSDPGNFFVINERPLREGWLDMNVKDPFVLFLVSEQPLLWNLKSNQSKLLAVILMGDAQSQVEGIPKTIPIHRVTNTDKDPCDYQSGNLSHEAQLLSYKLFPHQKLYEFPYDKNGWPRDFYEQIVPVFPGLTTTLGP